MGATGRVGRGVAARIADAGGSPVLVGRDPQRLRVLAEGIGGGASTVVASSNDQIVAEIRRHHPAVVLNTIGPFSETAAPIARACLPGSSYLDLANDIVAVPALLGLHDEAVAVGSTLVTGAAFGVLACEAVVAKLCQDRPAPSVVRVDALASVELEAGVMGEALATSIIEVLPLGGRRYKDGQLMKARLGSDPQHLTLPDGEEVTVGTVPTGDLHAAWITSGAPAVTATSSEIPTALPARAIVLPVVGALMSIGPVRRFAARRLAATKLKPRPRPREHSWGHAVIRWPDGTGQEGWLRAPDGMAYTIAIAAEVAMRLARGDAPPGAYTPATAFGPDIAADVGGEFI